MKKYLLIGSWKEIEFKVELTKEDLVALKEKILDWILNLEDETFFDSEKNEWRKVSEINA